MASTPNSSRAAAPSALLAALMPWDLGLRTFDALLSSGQEVSEQVDRITRAGRAEPAALSERAAAPMLPVLGFFGEWQGATLQWMAQAWQQWFSLLAAFNPVTVRGEGGPGSALQATPLTAGLNAPEAPRPSPGRAAREARRLAERASADLEHAVASATPRAAAGRSKPKARAARKSGRAR